MPLSDLEAIIEPISRQKKSKFKTRADFQKIQPTQPVEAPEATPEAQQAQQRISERGILGGLVHPIQSFKDIGAVEAGQPQATEQQLAEKRAKAEQTIESSPTLKSLFGAVSSVEKGEARAIPQAISAAATAPIEIAAGTIAGIPQVATEAVDFIARGIELGMTPVELVIALSKGELPERGFITKGTEKIADAGSNFTEFLEGLVGLKESPLTEAGEYLSPLPAAKLAQSKKLTKPFTKVKKMVSEATGTAGKTRGARVIEETSKTFEGAAAKESKFVEAKARAKTASSELLKEGGKTETVVGEKVTADFSKTKFANKKVQNEVTERFMNNTDKIIDRGDLANNALKLSEMTPTGGQSNFAATKIRKYILDNTSQKFAKLSDEFSEASRAIDVIDTKAFVNSRSITQEMKLSDSMKARIAKIKNPSDKKALIEELLSEKKSIGTAMDAEIKNLSGQTIDGNTFRSGLEGTLKEQGVILKREPVSQINKKDLDAIIKENPDDPRVQQLLQDQKTIDAGKPSKTAASLERKIIKDGNPDLEKTKQLLLQMKPTEEGDLLRSILPKDLVEDIVKSRTITPEKWKLVKKWLLISGASAGGIKIGGALID